MALRFLVGREKGKKRRKKVTSSMVHGEQVMVWGGPSRAGRGSLATLFYKRCQRLPVWPLSQSLRGWGSKPCRSLRESIADIDNRTCQSLRVEYLMCSRTKHGVGMGGERGGSAQVSGRFWDFGSYFEWDWETLEGWAEEGNELHFTRTTDHCVNNRWQKGKGKSRVTSQDAIEFVQEEDVFFSRVGAGEVRKNGQIG